LHLPDFTGVTKQIVTQLKDVTSWAKVICKLLDYNQ